MENKTVLQLIRDNNRKWFGNDNAKIFGDKEYKAYSTNHGNYFMQITTMWTDKLVYLVREVGQGYKIGDILEEANTLDGAINFINQ